MSVVCPIVASVVAMVRQAGWQDIRVHDADPITSRYQERGESRSTTSFQENPAARPGTGARGNTTPSFTGS
jgi:hypothetical protein